MCYIASLNKEKGRNYNKVVGQTGRLNRGQIDILIRSCANGASSANIESPDADMDMANVTTPS